MRFCHSWIIISETVVLHLIETTGHFVFACLIQWCMFCVIIGMDAGVQEVVMQYFTVCNFTLLVINNVKKNNI